MVKGSKDQSNKRSSQGKRMEKQVEETNNGKNAGKLIPLIKLINTGKVYKEKLNKQRTKRISRNILFIKLIDEGPRKKQKLIKQRS